jgi:hypothetical protein
VPHLGGDHPLDLLGRGEASVGIPLFTHVFSFLWPFCHATHDAPKSNERQPSWVTIRPAQDRCKRPFTHFHGDYVHTHTITHIHGHDHFRTDANHAHQHTLAELEKLT